jgi:hypothetical protein
MDLDLHQDDCRIWIVVCGRRKLTEIIAQNRSGLEQQAPLLVVSKLYFITERGARMTVSRRATLAILGAAGSAPFFARAAAAELTSIRIGIIPIESSCLAFYGIPRYPE